MRHLAAYILLVCGGNATPSAGDVTSVLSQAGIEVDTERLEKLIGELAGKDINELVELGKEKLMPMGSGGGGGGGGAAPAAAAAGGAAPAAEKKAEKPKEEEVDPMEGGMDMFGGGGGGKDY